MSLVLFIAPLSLAFLLLVPQSIKHGGATASKNKLYYVPAGYRRPVNDCGGGGEVKWRGDAS